MANRRFYQFPNMLEPGIVELYGNAVFSGSSNATINAFKGATAINHVVGTGKYALTMSEGYPTNYPFEFASHIFGSSSSGLRFVATGYNLGPGGPCTARTVTFDLLSGSTLVDPPYVFSASFAITAKNSTVR